MSNLRRPQLIEEGMQATIGDGKDLSYFRKELEIKGVEEEERKVVMRYLSDQLIRFDELKAKRSIGLFTIAAGVLALLFGIVVFIYSTGILSANPIHLAEIGNNLIGILSGAAGLGIAGIVWGFIQIKNFKDYLERNKVKLNKN